jgi:outer membrane receptor for monomeric catechols
MASLFEYFEKDTGRGGAMSKTWPLTDPSGKTVGEIVARLAYAHDAHAKYVAFYIRASEESAKAVVSALLEIDTVVKFTDSLEMNMGSAWEKYVTKSSDLVFTGRVLVYSEAPVSAERQEELKAIGIARKHHLGHLEERVCQ